MKHNLMCKYDRVVIMPMEAEHIEKWRNLRNTHRHCYFNSKYIDEEQQKKWYNEYLKKDNEYMFSVLCDNVWIGAIALCNVDIINKKAEIGRLAIDRSSVQKEKLGVDIMLAVCEIAFKQLSLEKLTAEVLKNNIRSIKTSINAGFHIVSEYTNNGIEIIAIEKRSDE